MSNEDNTTSSATERWVYTNDILAGCIITTTAVLIYLKYDLPTAWTVTLLLCAIWLFGPKTVTALNKLRGK